EMIHRGFGRVVGGVRDARIAHRSNGGDVHDRTPTLLLHDRNYVLHREEAALQVDGEDTVPRLFRQLDDPADLGYADVVVEHVDSAEPFAAGRDVLLDVSRPGCVGLADLGLAALAADDLGRLLGGRPVEIDAADARALACEGP